MNITPTNIRAHVLTLTETELRDLIADLPAQSRFAGPLKASLNGAFDAEEPQRAKHAAGRRSPKGRTEKSPARQGTIGASGKQLCGICGRKIFPKYMALHLRKKHGQDTASVAASSD